MGDHEAVVYHSNSCKRIDFSQKRIIIENFFGRLLGKFRILVHQWRLDERLYERLFSICCSLVNFDMRPNEGSPLRSDEPEHHHDALMFMTAEQRLNENGQMNPANQEIDEESARIAQTGPREPIEKQDVNFGPNQEE
jgi:hypothetical protein